MRNRLRWLVFGLALAALASAQDVAGIKLGMPIKEAMQALGAHNPNLKVVPDSLQYPGLPHVLTYGINAVGGGEGFYFLVTMPPNKEVVSKVTWVVHFGPDKIPRQDVVVASLAQKYGPISWDTLPASLTLGSRELFWVDDAEGKRVRGDAFTKCRGQSTFFMNGAAAGSRTQFDPTNVRLPPLLAKLRIDQGYTNQSDRLGEECGQYTMVRARLFKTRVMGVSVPNLVEYVVVMIASGPLDRKATNATHAYVTKGRGAKQK